MAKPPLLKDLTGEERDLIIEAIQDAAAGKRGVYDTIPQNLQVYVSSPELQKAAQALLGNDLNTADGRQKATLENKDAKANQNGGKIAVTFSPQNAGITASSAALRYPADKSITDDTDYVTFSFYDYKPPFQAKAGGDAGSGGNLGASYAQYNASVTLGTDGGLKKANGYNNIVLYMPEDIQGQYGAKWGGAGFGAVFQEIAQAVASGGVPNLPSAVNRALGSIKIAGYKTAVEALNKGLNASVNVNQLMSGVSGTIINPNVEMMYESPELRTFNMKFKMQARSSNEAKNIKKICNTFKRAMLPTYGGQSFGGVVENTSALLTIPKVCQVNFMTASSLNNFVPQYKAAAITAVNVNYTPDGAWATYEGGTPVATELSVQFKELKLIFANEVAIDSEKGTF
tara:strand:+ start:68 stop:1267 length:1200 start_codon:yes stop_codon:yes gene_type:complete